MVGERVAGQVVQNGGGGGGGQKDRQIMPGGAVLQLDRQTPTSATNYERSSESIPKLDTAAGQKRTANGEIKWGSSVSPVNRPDATMEASPQRSPQIGQLTDKLRTRLTYAMVKVQHGWESKSINEVENLAVKQSLLYSGDQADEPASSPRRKAAGNPERPSTRGSPPSAIVMGKRSPGAASTSSSGASDYGVVRQTGLPPNRLHKPSLAPPVDLGPRNPRRSNPPAFAMPSMSSNPNSNLSDSSIASIRPHITTTPPVHYDAGSSNASSQKQPSSAMEQDAIETLLFMSSPGNTQHRPSSQQQQNNTSPNIEHNTLPRKSKLSIPVTLAHVANTDTIPVSPRKKLITEDMDLRDDQNIDQALDQMPVDQGEDDTSSDEENTST